MGLRDSLIERFQLFPDRHQNGNGKHAAEAKAASGVSIRPGADLQFHGADGTRIIHYLTGQASSAAETVTRQTAFAAAWYCYVAMHCRASKLSEPDLWVADETKDGDEWVTPHPLVPFLEQPSPDLDMAALIYRTSLYLDATGQALWVADMNRAGLPGRVIPFHGDEFTVEPADELIRGLFRVKTARGEEQFRMAQAGRGGRPLLVHWVEENPGDWWRGISRIDVALAAMNLGQRVQATAKSLLINAIFPSTVVLLDPDGEMSDTDFERVKAQIREHALLENKGDPLVLTGGGRTTVVSAKLSELVPGELLDRVESACASVFGVPAVILQYLVGLKNSPWSQMEEARRSFYEDTIDPQWTRFEKKLTSSILRRVDPDVTHRLRFDRSQIRALKADDTKRADVVAKLVDVWTIDQALIYTGQEPIGGDLGETIISHAKPSTQAAPEPARTDSGVVASEDGKARRSPRRVERKQATVWQRFDLQAKAQEESWTSAVRAQLRKDRARILELADEVFGAEKSRKDIGDLIRRDLVQKLLAEIDAFSALARGDWKAIVEPLIRSTGRTGLRALAADIGVAFDLLIPGIESYTEDHAAHLVTQITKTTRESIASSLSTGLANGENMDSLRKRIEDSDAAFGEARAELIARTETVGVTNGAQHRSMREYALAEGATVAKTWLATDDERTRDSHDQLNGTTLGIDETFANGCAYPGDPAGEAAEVCNCRCTLTYDIAFADDPLSEAA